MKRPSKATRYGARALLRVKPVLIESSRNAVHALFPGPGKKYKRREVFALHSTAFCIAVKRAVLEVISMNLLLVRGERERLGVWEIE